MTKITIFSAFWVRARPRSSKSSLPTAMPGEKLVLIENEFGEIGIDGGFLKEAGIQITEMNSGCICCSLVGDFRSGPARRCVERVRIPTASSSSPPAWASCRDVIAARCRPSPMQTHVKLAGFVTVADAGKVKPVYEELRRILQ